MEVSGRKIGGKIVELTPSTDQNCQPCAEEGRNHKAHGYCTNCREYLCRECYNIHGREKLTKNHVLLKAADMPDGEPSPIQTGAIDEVGTDILTERCPIRSGKVIEYHCKTHDKTACSVCVMVTHRNCPVNYIPDIAKEIADTEIHDEIKTLSGLIDKLNCVKQQTSTEETEKVSAVYSSAVQRYRDELVAIIDKLAAEAEVKKLTYIDSVMQGLDDSHTLSQNHLDKLESVMLSMTDKLKTGHKNDLFFLLRQAKRLISECKTSIPAVTKNEDLQPQLLCAFKKNRTLLNMLQNVELLGELVTKRYPYLCDEIKTKASAEKYNCSISGMHVLEDGRLIVSDKTNESVKLFNTNNKLISRVSLQSAPYDVAKVSSGEVIVCLPENRMLQFLSISDTLTLGRVIRTEEQYLSVAPCGDKLIGCTGNKQNSEIVKLDMSGKKINTIWKYTGCIMNQTVEDLFGHPIVCVRLHPYNNNRVYVSYEHGVACVTLDGKVLGKCSIPFSLCLAVDPDGSVYCAAYPNSINHLTEDCTVKDTFNCEMPLKSFPQCISYNHMDNTLYVPYTYSNTINVFQLSD